MARPAPFVPVDEAAENAVLAELLTSPDTFTDICDLLHVDDFGHPGNRLIYAAMLACDAAGRPVDVITVTDELRKQRALTKAGGADRIANLASSAASAPAATVNAYTAIITEKALLRRLHTLGRDIAGAAVTPDVDAHDLLETAEQGIFDLGRGNSRKAGPTPIPAAVAETMRNMASVRSQLLLGHPTGFPTLDKLTAGLQSGQLILIAGRPAMGKSSLAWQIAAHAAQATGKHAVFISYEMSAGEIVERGLSQLSGLPMQSIRSGAIPAGADRDLAVAAERLAGLPILIDDDPPTTISGLRSTLRRTARRSEVGLVVVDYIQLMDADRRSRTEPNRTQEIADVSRGLKRLAVELGVPVVALSQLNRSVENRVNRRPTLNALRDSGALEQDANLVMAVFRESVYREQADPYSAELLILKQRNGPAGITLPLRWDPSCVRFSERDSTPSELRTIAASGGDPNLPSPF